MTTGLTAGRLTGALLLTATFLATADASAHAPRASLQGRIASAHAREAALAADIASLTGRIRSLEAREGDVATRLASLETDLALYRRRLARVNTLFDLQTRQLALLRREYAASTDRLRHRLVQIYEEGNHSPLEVVLGARSLGDVVDRVDYMQSVAAQDRRVVAEVSSARTEMRKARARTARARASIAAAARVIAVRRRQAAELRARLLASRQAVAGTRGDRQRTLASTKASEREWVEEANALQQPSAAVAGAIASASSGGATPPSSAGLVWPVSGPITSPYGMRWGSLHPGLDIGAPAGAPIRAAASGRVLVAAYNGGYGNLVVIDHGRGLATAYAHQARLAVAAGQTVAQGQVIGYVGSTGVSTGPHLHFEVRVNGSTVDPLGYL